MGRTRDHEQHARTLQNRTLHEPTPHEGTSMKAHSTSARLPHGPLVGMVHLRALPGSPSHAMTPTDIVRTAVSEAKVLESAGFDALIVENMHDRPYLAHAGGADTVATFAVAVAAVTAAVRIPVGVQVLSGATSAALAIAHAAGGSFVRAEGFVFASVADEGLLAEACAGPLLRERRRLGATNVRILADIRKKHSSHAITGDLDGAAWARAAEFFGADGVIVTGAETAAVVDMQELAAVRAATRLPVLVGSGATPQSAAALLEHADALIVGSALKREGLWSNDIDHARADEMVRAARGARGR